MLPKTGTLIAFDFGLKRIGVAVGELARLQAHPLETICEVANAARFARISALIAEWKPVAGVVGYPTFWDGHAHGMSARAERFARQLEGRFALPIFLADERFSSVAAQARLHEAGLSSLAAKARIDAVAAQMILEVFFERVKKEDLWEREA